MTIVFMLEIAFRKKVESEAKKTGCELIGEWKRSMVNHLYWSATSTEDGNGKMIKEKWLSLANHIHNKHKGYGTLYKECSHGPSPNRKWLQYRKCTL